MKTSRNIIVEVDYAQNTLLEVNGTFIKSARQYSDNWREKNPSVALIMEGNEKFTKGQFILCHYNHFEWNSEYLISETNNKGIYAIPDNDMILGIINDEGDLMPINGNIFVDRIYQKNGIFEIPKEYEKPFIDKVKVIQDGGGYHTGDIIYTYRYGNYEIFYVWENKEKRAFKVDVNDIVGVVRFSQN